MTKFSFYLVGDPVPKARPRLGRGGRVFTPEKTLVFEQEIAGACLNEMFLQNVEIIDQPVQVKMLFERKTWGKVDIDNLVKAVLDGLNGVAFTDDKLVFNLVAVKVLGVGKDAKTSVEIETLDPSIGTKPVKARKRKLK